MKWVLISKNDSYIIKTYQDENIDPEILKNYGVNPYFFACIPKNSLNSAEYKIYFFINEKENILSYTNNSVVIEN